MLLAPREGGLRPPRSLVPWEVPLALRQVFLVLRSGVDLSIFQIYKFLTLGIVSYARRFFGRSGSVSGPSVNVFGRSARYGVFNLHIYEFRTSAGARQARKASRPPRFLVP